VRLVTVKSAVGIGNGVVAIFAVVATVTFGAGSIGIGLLFAARGLGALLGPIVLRRALARPSRLMPGLAVSMVGYGLAYLGVAVSPWFWLAVPLVVIAHIFGGGNYAITPDDGSTFNTLAQWQAQNHERHSFVAALSSLFVNASADDYHLSATSPAIDRGQTLAIVTTDKEGNARPEGAASDIGCYEFP
jgi:hypothetical protein